MPHGQGFSYAHTTIVATVRRLADTAKTSSAGIAYRSTEWGVAFTADVVRNWWNPNSRRTTETTVHQLMGLAHALDVAPIELLTGGDNPVELPNGDIVTAETFRAWFVGIAPLPDTTNPDTYRQNTPQGRWWKSPAGIAYAELIDRRQTAIAAYAAASKAFDEATADTTTGPDQIAPYEAAKLTAAQQWRDVDTDKPDDGPGQVMFGPHADVALP